MRQGDRLSVRGRFSGIHLSRQIEHKATQMASEVFRIGCTHEWHQLFMEEEHRVMSAWMLLSKVQGQVRRGWTRATENALAAQQMQSLNILPQIGKTSMYYDLF